MFSNIENTGPVLTGIGQQWNGMGEQNEISRRRGWVSMMLLKGPSVLIRRVAVAMA